MKIKEYTMNMVMVITLVKQDTGKLDLLFLGVNIKRTTIKNEYYIHLH